jgi:hypothetical protein
MQPWVTVLFSCPESRMRNAANLVIALHVILSNKPNSIIGWEFLRRRSESAPEALIKRMEVLKKHGFAKSAKAGVSCQTHANVIGVRKPDANHLSRPKLLFISLLDRLFYVVLKAP